MNTDSHRSTLTGDEKPADDEEIGPLSSVRKSQKKLTVTRNRVIYPENKYIRYWDALMLVLIILYAFTVPYQLGVSGGSNLLRSVRWFVVTVCMNTCFFIDTFLHFFRAYRDKSGRMVIDPKKIRKNYGRSLAFPCNLLSNLPTTIIFYVYGQTRLADIPDNSEFYRNQGSALLVVLKFSDVLKILRLSRAQRLLSNSEFVREFREKRKAFTIRMWVFIFLIVVAAHWFACIWSFVAFVEAGGFSTKALLLEDNWIGYWYNSSYVEGGLDPLGWENDLNRYVMSLFWAIQTITSIGYGNISPFTPAEWWVGAVLQLCAGILWAYIIGGLVGVVTAMEVKNEMFRERIDEANDLISAFLPEEKKALGRNRNSYDHALDEKKRVAKRIRRYIYTQSERPRSNLRFVSSIEQAFPVLESLSPNLQRSASLMLGQKFLEKIPYLSSRFLSNDEQSLVAHQSVLLELPGGEVFPMNQGVNEYGRGILVQLNGLAWRSSNLKSKMPIVSGGVLGRGMVLLEDGHPGVRGVVGFPSFSVVMLIPRPAILSALARNPAAWKECARWWYLGASLVAKAIGSIDEQKTDSIVLA